MMEIPIIKVQCEDTGQIFALANKADKYVVIEEGCIKPKPGYKIIGFEKMSMDNLMKHYQSHELKKLQSYEASVFDINDVKRLLNINIQNIKYIEHMVTNVEKEWYSALEPSEFPKEIISLEIWEQLLKSATELARRMVKSKFGIEVEQAVNPKWNLGYYTAYDLLAILVDYFSATTLEEKGECEQRFYELKASVIDEEAQNE